MEPLPFTSRELLVPSPKFIIVKISIWHSPNAHSRPLSAIMTTSFVHPWTDFQNIVNFSPENKSQAQR